MITPGPWKVNKYGSVGAGQFGTEPIVARVEPFYGPDTKYGDHRENLHAIARLPDLLKERDEMIEALRECVDTAAVNTLAISKARALLARIEGEEG